MVYIVVVYRRQQKWDAHQLNQKSSTKYSSLQREILQSQQKYSQCIFEELSCTVGGLGWVEEALG